MSYSTFSYLYLLIISRETFDYEVSYIIEYIINGYDLKYLSVC